MSIVVAGEPLAQSVEVSDDLITVHLTDGRTHQRPVSLVVATVRCDSSSAAAVRTDRQRAGHPLAGCR